MELTNIKPDLFYETFCGTYYAPIDKQELELAINEHIEQDKWFEDNEFDVFDTFDNKVKEYEQIGVLLKRCNQVLSLIELYRPEVIKKHANVIEGLKILTKTYQEKHLITRQLYEIIGFIVEVILQQQLKVDLYKDDITHEFNLDKIKKHIKSTFKWNYTKEDIFNVVRNEANWLDIERDIAIYKERKKGVFIKELEKIYNLDKSTISVITKKVRGKINYIKGHLFEHEYKKHLESLNIYDKVDNIGSSGQPDILCYRENINQLDVYSLKMLKIKRKTHFIPKNELIPEYKIAYENSLSYDTVNLFLVVFNYENDNIETIPLDWKNPTNVTVNRD